VSYPWNAPTVVMSGEYIGLRWAGQFLVWWWRWRWRWWKAQDFVSDDVATWYSTTTQQTNLILHKLTAIRMYVFCADVCNAENIEVTSNKMCNIKTKQHENW